MIRKCPNCKDKLIFPRNDSAYCEECGWPDEDFSEKYIYPKVGDELSRFQPGLQFYDGKKWVESGINFGRCSYSFIGLYRYPNKRARNMPLPHMRAKPNPALHRIAPVGTGEAHMRSWGCNGLGTRLSAFGGISNISTGELKCWVNKEK